MPAHDQFSPKLMEHPIAQSAGALDRIAVAKKRIQSILDRETVAHPRTLEQKISEQGPKPLRVDPHLVHLAIADLLALNRLRLHKHQTTGDHPWYSNVASTLNTVAPRLNELAPLYDQVTGHGFGNLVGDALELVTYKCLALAQQKDRKFAFIGTFHLDQPKTKEGRYKKTQPQRSIGSSTTTKEADFVQFGHDCGALCIECKNYREWVYPTHQIIRELIIKAFELKCSPVLVARRLHYTTITNFLEPAGIIAHETYYQYYPADQKHLADRVRHKRSLGFTDVRASEEPDPRTVRFFTEHLPKIAPRMTERWAQYQDYLVAYAAGDTNLSQLYTSIGSPAGGKWKDFTAPQ